MLDEAFLILVVELVWKTWICNIGLGCPLQALSATFAQFFLQKDDVLGVALVRRISNVSNEWDQAYGKVDCHVELHPHFDASGQLGLDRGAGAIDHEGKQ